MLLRLVKKCLIFPLFRHQNVRQFNKHLFSPIYYQSHILKKYSTDEDEINNEAEEDQTNFIQSRLKIVNCKDPVLERIEKCESIPEFVEISDEISTKDQLVQLLLLHGKIRNRNEPTILKNVKEFVDKVDKFYPQMNEIELAISLLYLRLLSINTKHGTLQNMIEILLNHIKEKKDQPDLMVLSIFTEFLSMEKSLYGKLIMADLIPIVSTKFQDCKNAEEILFLASALNNIHPVISLDALENTKSKINQLLDQEIINENHPKIIFRFLNFLNFPHWSSFNGQIIQRLLLVLTKSIPKMTKKELFFTNRSIQIQYEPASIIPLIRDRAQELLDQTKDVQLLQILCLYCSPEQRIKYVEMLREEVLSYQTTLTPGSDSLPIFFKILRLLKISDTNLCDCFWTKTVNRIFSMRESELKHRLPKIFFRYMNFNNNLGGTYRHFEFEKIVTEYCIEELRTASYYLPKDFVKFASFVIAYSDHHDSIPNFIIEKLIIQQEQLDLFDCQILSRSLEILQGFRLKSGNNSKVLKDQVEILQYIIDNCAKMEIQNPNLHLRQMNSLFSSYVKRRGTRDSQLFYDILKWYEKPNLELNSRSIRELCLTLQSSKVTHDSVCDQFYNYIVENKKIVTGETVEKVLTTSYSLSFFPENPEAFECCSEIIKRDFNVMSGLSIVQALLALTFYKQVPYELIMQVFQGDFIKKLEQEIQMSYRLDVYPRRVMTLVMELNRAICLDFPEYNVRWFQQNFIEAQMSKKPIIRDHFHNEVRNLLLKIVPSREHLVINRVTPYGYNIDFEIHIDNFNKFLKPNSEFSDSSFKPKVSKIAVILLNVDTFCFNEVNRLKGNELLRMRHLEMMDYKVVHVKKSDFKILYENITAKIKHMKSLLQLSG